MNEVKGLQEDHGHTNWRIFWIFLFNAVAGSALLFEYLKGFKEAKFVLAIASAFFLVFHNAYTLYWTWIAEPNFYRGNSKVDGTVWLTSRLALPKAEYVLKVSKPTADGKCKEVTSFTTSVGNWVTEDGFVDVPEVVSDLEKLRFHS